MPSWNSCKIYISLFERFINAYKVFDLLEIDERMIRDYLQTLMVEGKSKSYSCQMVNAIKFNYEKVMGMPNRFYSIDRPLKSKTLPIVISAESVQSMIEVTSNIKHKCIVMLLYSSGLRRSELLNLKISDIDSNRMVIKVNDAKGKKDRITILSQNLLEYLRIYYKVYRPKEYLFEGENGVNIQKLVLVES